MKDRASNEYVGTVQATVYADLTANIAYQTFASCHQRGDAIEACARVLGHLFNDYGVSFVEALIDTRNTASIKLVESLGFTVRETIKNADFFKGSTSHEYRYQLMRRQRR